MKSQECRGLGSQRYGVQVHGVLRVWDPGDKGCREQRAQSPRGHGILGLWDPGHTRAWTQGSRAHGVWATAGLCTGAVGHSGPWAWDAADVQCPGTRMPGRAVSHPPARPGRAQPGLRQFLACPLPAPVGGSGWGLALPFSQHTCAHMCLLLNLWLSHVSRE